MRIPAGKARLGARFEEIPFGWDNEFSEISVNVAEFQIDSLPVTNGEFLEFVIAGGYTDAAILAARRLALEGVGTETASACWLKREKCWCYRAMFDLLPLEKVASWPVYVSLAEARAYAVWRGLRLPTEAEYQRAAFYGPNERESRYPWGDGEPNSRTATLILPHGRRSRSVLIWQVRAAGGYKSSLAMAGS